MSASARKNRPLVVGIIALLLLALLVWLFRDRIHFDWHSLFQQLHSVSLGYIAAGLAIIYACYWLRAMRWAVLVSPLRRTSAAELLGSQLVGFTAIVLVGRLADLVRPYLVARKLSLPVASQLAIYSIERAFDLGAAAILFSLTLAVAPRNLPHHAVYMRAGILSLVATTGIAVFAIALRVAGEKVAALSKRLLSTISENLADKLSKRILDFSAGLRILTSIREFILAFALSILMWVGIALCYLLSARAFVSDPTLAHMSFTATMLIMASSMGGSLLQLPVVGWFTQIAVIGAALHGFFGIGIEAASACAATAFFVTNLSVIPAGFIAARLEGTSLREAVNQSGTPSLAPYPKLP